MSFCSALLAVDLPALSAIGWGTVEKDCTTTTSAIVGAQRQSKQSIFLGPGYGARQSSDALTRRSFTALDTSFASGTRKIDGKQRRAERYARAEAETFAGENVYLAMESSSSASTHKTESVLMADDVFAVVDTGTSVSISTLKKRNMFDRFDDKATVSIAGFNNSTSRSSGSGTIVGYVYDIEKKRIAVRIPRVHEVPGAPHDLLSVSNMKKHGFSFHFNPGES